MVYISGWILNYILFFTGKLCRQKHVYVLISVTLLGLVVVLRGNVGVDTGGIYAQMATQPSYSLDVEPIFGALLRLMVFAFPTALLAVTAGIGCVYVSIILIYICRVNKEELFLYCMFFVPASFWTLGINALRLGLALGIILLAVQSLRLKQNKLAVLLFIVASLTHYSSILIIAIFCVIRFHVRLKSVVLLTVSSLLSILFVVKLNAAYFVFKYAAYKTFKSPSRYSGSASLIIMSILLCGVLWGNLGTRTKIKIVTISVAASAVFYSVAMYSYAGLRLLEIANYATILAVLSLFQSTGTKMGRSLRIAIVIAGLFGASVEYYHMNREVYLYSAIPSPSLPYKLFWE